MKAVDTSHAPAPAPKATAPGARAPSTAAPAPPRSRAWLWIAAVLLAQLAVWTAWITIAAQHPVADVPLVTGRAR